MTNVLPFKKIPVVEVAENLSDVSKLQAELTDTSVEFEKLKKTLERALQSHEKEIKVHKRHEERQDEIIKTYAHMLIEVALGKKQGETAEQALKRLVDKTYQYLLENGTYETPEKAKVA